MGVPSSDSGTCGVAFTHTWPTQPKRTHAGCESHLELDDRLADHREQPRRQRDQLRRELHVRHTGSDRRRLPVPCEQDRHEQLQQLQPHLRSFALEPAGEGGKARPADGGSAFPAAYCPVCTPVAVYPEYAVRTRGEAIDCLFSTPWDPVKLGSRSAGAPPRAAAGCVGWPRLPRPAKPNGMSKLQSPERRLGKKDRGVKRAHEDVQPAARRHALGMIWQRSCHDEPLCAPSGGC